MKFILTAHFTPLTHIPHLARTAEECGWHAITFADHVVHPKTLRTPYPYSADGERIWPAFTPWPDPWVMIGALATITSRLRFTNNVLVLAMRNPFLLAKAISTAAALSKDRVNLGIGVGWSRDEFNLLGQDFHNRGRRTDEMITVLRKLWSGKMVEHHGEFYQFDPLEMTPAPGAPIPLWVGGMSPAAHQRAAQLGDGWISDWQSGADICACIARINELRKAAGREQQPFDFIASPTDVFDRDGYARLEEAGVTHLLIQPWSDTQDVTRQCDAIRRFADRFVDQ